MIHFEVKKLPLMLDELDFIHFLIYYSLIGQFSNHLLLSAFYVPDTFVGYCSYLEKTTELSTIKYSVSKS